VRVEAIPAFTDNYIWAIISDDKAWVVDPGDTAPVIEFMELHGLALSGILITHHHFDHVGGVDELRSLFPECQVFGPEGLPIESKYRAVSGGDTVSVLGVNTKVSAVPGHTLDHIAYLVAEHLFCGDTLFSAGCGRIFEGTAEQMYASLTRLATIECSFIYPTHEYTLANLDFCLYLEPDRAAITEYRDKVVAARALGKPSLPTNWATERFINPYLRCDNDRLRDAVSVISNKSIKSNIELFTVIRGLKDQF